MSPFPVLRTAKLSPFPILRTAKRLCVTNVTGRVLSWSSLNICAFRSLQKDTFKWKWSLAKSYFKQNYCLAWHTRFAVFIPLPSCCVSLLRCNIKRDPSLGNILLREFHRCVSFSIAILSLTFILFQSLSSLNWLSPSNLWHSCFLCVCFQVVCISLEVWQRTHFTT